MEKLSNRFLAAYLIIILSIVYKSEMTNTTGQVCSDPIIACPGPKILNENNGRIISHSSFKSVNYTSNTNCIWIIKAPKDHVISVQLTYLSIEKSLNCNNDYLSFYDGFQILSSTRVNKICGNVITNKIKSWTNVLTVEFVTNTQITDLGFQLRYTFYEKVSQLSQSILFSDSIKPANCGSREVRCVTSMECIATSWKCDGINDCQDESDEMNCNSKTCAASTSKCSGQCLVNEQICQDVVKCPEILNKITPPDNATRRNDTSRAGCSYQPIPNTEMRIVGGSVAREGSWPWQVSLRNSDGVLCGGSIVNAKWIVTAAHCVEGRSSPQTWTVHAGRYTLNGNDPHAQVQRVTRVIKNENYNSENNENDITMMKLAGLLTLNDYVQPVCIGTSVPRNNMDCYITGWGVTHGTGGDGYLKQANVPIIDQNQCQKWYGNSLSEGMICAGYENGGIDSCQGDSGGPLVCMINSKFQLIGVTSWGMGCAQPRQPGVYTAVPKYLQWIINVLSKN